MSVIRAHRNKFMDHQLLETGRNLRNYLHLTLQHGIWRTEVDFAIMLLWIRPVRGKLHTGVSGPLSQVIASQNTVITTAQR